MKIYGVYLKLNEEKDRDIKEKLETVSKKQRYIKNLIREDIKRGSENIKDDLISRRALKKAVNNIYDEFFRNNNILPHQLINYHLDILEAIVNSPTAEQK